MKSKKKNFKEIRKAFEIALKERQKDMFLYFFAETLAVQILIWVCDYLSKREVAASTE